MEDEEQALVDQALKDVTEMPWPEPETVTKGVTTLNDAETHQQRFERLQNPVSYTHLTLPTKA